MSEIDIRCTPEDITLIRFNDKAPTDNALATHVIKGDPLLTIPFQKRYTHIGRPGWADRYVVAITDKEDAQNLIKALQWAVKNNWFGE